jgi:hypothetical protein
VRVLATLVLIACVGGEAASTDDSGDSSSSGDVAFPPDDTGFPSYYLDGEIAPGSWCVWVQGYGESCFDENVDMWADNPDDASGLDGFGGFDGRADNVHDAEGQSVDLAVGDLRYATVVGAVPDDPALPYTVTDLHYKSGMVEVVISCELYRQIESAEAERESNFFGVGVTRTFESCPDDDGLTTLGLDGEALAVTVEVWEPDLADARGGTATLRWHFVADCGFGSGTWEARGVASIAP